MQRKQVMGFTTTSQAPHTWRPQHTHGWQPLKTAGVAQSAATTPAGGGTALPLVLFTLGGLAVLAGVAHLKEKLK